MGESVIDFTLEICEVYFIRFTSVQKNWSATKTGHCYCGKQKKAFKFSSEGELFGYAK